MPIAIIGAGFGGLCAALKLNAAGYQNVIVYERAPEVGGTWQANTYPGAACDAPSHIYSYSFAQDVDWSRRFAPGPEIQAYLHRCVEQAGLASRIRTNTAVTEAQWSGTEWIITLADGSQERADLLIPAVGHLCLPSIPDLPGLETFGGPTFHTARWDHSVDLTGKRVAIVGTGASAVQAIPAIADTVNQMTVFQRSATYVMSKPEKVYTDRLHRVYRRISPAKLVARGAIWGAFEMFNYSFWRFPTTMTLLQRMHARQLRREVPDPALRAALTPDYPIGCKRIPIANDFYPTMNRADVALVTDHITGVTATGLSTAAAAHPADVIIFATGFETTQFLSSVVIRGRDGRTLQEHWTDRAGAYLGLSVPDFPNMFLMWGPNTNLGAGSIVYMMEAQADHVIAAADILSTQPGSTVEISTAAYREFLDEIRTRQSRTIWAGCRNWYHDDRGNDIHNWHGSMRTYRRRVRQPHPQHYRVTSPVGDQISATVE
ncbi:flavin-containing monooxygenase [Mycolicibacterium hodleri]|uniref:flavin-containing monooxygenase n=1 Tax=Mycolicibacterium hodleri TaxID=49897 RepID=UPI0013755F94|nr:NAD(P)/FAD-dependent oxidoreductase [Mycolicibacterium hodleri]